MTDENDAATENLARARAWLAHAVEHDGEEYLRARSVFLAQPTIALPILLGEAKTVDWRHRLTASAIASRIHSAPLVAHAEELLVEKGLPAPRNIMGKHRIEDLGKAIARLGPAIDPWLFEVVLKEKRPHSERQQAILFLAITERRSPELLPMLRSIVFDETAAIEIRVSAVMAAARTGEAEDREDVHDIAKRSDAPTQLRRAAILVLSEHPEDVPPGFQRTCESIVLDPSAPAELRAEAVSALDAMVARSSLPVLHRAAENENEDEVLGALCMVFVTIVDSRSIPVLRGIGKRVVSPDVKTICKESLEELEWKLANKERPG